MQYQRESVPRRIAASSFLPMLALAAGLGWLAFGCSNPPPHATDGAAARTAPPLNRMFRDSAGSWIEDPAAFVVGGGRIYFDGGSCWLPDADSFDDFEAPSLGVPRGVTPTSKDCVADGQATGPIRFVATGNTSDLLPSKWCHSNDPNCQPIDR